ncbi:MAG TPA: flagellar hook-length control protein FliK [Oligoflexia bacterium]|nr:flagellar hook-length control protein FliK [Oligoflexia bacterium]
MVVDKRVVVFKRESGMIQEILNSGTGSYPVNGASNSETGDEVKQAFLALLQGLVGMVPHAPGIQSAIDVPRVNVELKARKQEEAIKPSEKKEQDITRNSSEGYNHNQNPEITTAPKESNVKDNPVKESATPKETQVVNDVGREPGSQKTPVKADSVVVEGNKMQSAVSEITVQNHEVAKQSFAPVESVIVKSEDVKMDYNSENKQVETKLAPETNSLTEKKSATVIDNYQPLSDASQSLSSYSESLSSQVNISNIKTPGKDNNLPSDNINIENQHDDSNLSEQGFLAKEIFEQLVANSEDQVEFKPSMSVFSDSRNAVSSLQLSQTLALASASGLIAEEAAESLISSRGLVDLMGVSLKDVSQKSQASLQARSAVNVSEAQQQKYVDKIKEVLARAAETKTTDSVTVKIDPPHLGEITVKVTQRNGEIHARLIPESREVEQTLKTRLYELAGVLQGLGFKPEEVHVSIGKDISDFQDLKNFSFSEGNRGASWENRGFSSKNEKRKGFNEANGSVESTIQSFPTSQLEEVSGWVA